MIYVINISSRPIGTTAARIAGDMWFESHEENYYYLIYSILNIHDD